MQVMTHKSERLSVGPSMLWKSEEDSNNGVSDEDDDDLAAQLGINREQAMRLLLGDYRGAAPGHVMAACKFRGIVKDFGWITSAKARKIAKSLGVRLIEG